MKNNKSEQYVAKMFKENEKLIYYVINKYFSLSEIDEQELYSAGTDGLLTAIKNFDENKNYKFSTYAFVCIKNTIKNYQRDALKLKCSNEKHLVSLNAVVNKNGTDDETLTLETSLIMADSYSFVDHFVQKEELKEVLKNFKYLTPTQQICLRYSLEFDGECSGELNKIYPKLGFTRQNFNDRVNSAKKRLILIFKSKRDCTIEELQERAKILRTEYPIITSIEEFKKYKNEKKKPFGK